MWSGIGNGLSSCWRYVFSGTDRPSERWHHGIPGHPYLFLRDLHRSNRAMQVTKDTRFAFTVLPSALVSIDFSGLRHSTVGRRFKRSRVRASGNVLSSAPYQRYLCEVHVLIIGKPQALSYFLCWLCDLNSIQLGKMTSPHSALTVHQTTKNQQAKQNRVNLVQYLDDNNSQFTTPDIIVHTYTWSDIKVIDLAFVLPVVIF